MKLSNNKAGELRHKMNSIIMELTKYRVAFKRRIYSRRD